MAISQQIDQLEQQLRAVRIEYERYFSGNLPIPPVPLLEKFRKNLTRTRNTRGQNSIERFRLSNLEASFHAFNEMFSRRIRRIEMGQSAVPRSAASAATEAQLDPSQGVRIGGDQDAASIESLYNALYRGAGSRAADLETFRTYIQQQYSKIQAKTGCRQVSFRVVEDEGKKKLRAKPVREKSRS